MEIAITVIGLTILIILILRQRDEIKSLRSGLAQTFDQLTSIKSLVEKLNETNRQNTTSAPIVEEPTPTISEVESNLAVEKDKEAEEKVDQIFFDDELETLLPPPLPTELVQPVLQSNTIPNIKPEEPISSEPKLSWFELFRQNNPDIEKFIGENLINKIGIIILVLGISFFVKYAIDKDWINEPARVGIGILCGGILLSVAHKLRSTYKAFSSVLVAGAIAIFYFTIGIAFHDYGLFSQTTAFCIMIGITAFSVFVSIMYDRQELAVLSLLGGFAVPFMLSNGQGNYHVLFTYIAILNIGMLSISYFKRWFIVNFAAFVLTILLVAGWYISESPNYTPALYNTLIYAGIYYLIFSVAFILNNVVHKNKFANYEITGIISNTAAFYAIGHHILAQTSPQYLGLFTILLGIYNIVFAILIYKKYQFDKNIIYVLIGLALTLATITIPVQLSKNYITIFWACEAVLLFWLTKKSQLRGFTFAGIIVQWLALISLMMDLFAYIDDSVPYIFAFNIYFITSLIAIGSLVSTYHLLKNHNYEYRYFGTPFNQVSYRKLVLRIAVILGYILPLMEIYYQSEAYFINEGTIFIFMYLYHMLYTGAIIAFSPRNMVDNHNLRYILCVFNLILYIIIAYRIPIIEKEFAFINNQPYFPYAMILHYVSLGILIYQFYYFIKQSATNDKFTQFKKPILPWIIAFVIVYILSTEVNIAFLAFATDYDGFYSIKNTVIKVGFPILWGILSFVFLIYGIRRNMKVARIIALTLLGVNILKLFILDIRDASETGKIIAFILLGVLILIISFVYQKIKKLIVDDNDKTSI